MELVEGRRAPVAFLGASVLFCLAFAIGQQSSPGWLDSSLLLLVGLGVIRFSLADPPSNTMVVATAASVLLTTVIAIFAFVATDWPPEATTGHVLDQLGQLPREGRFWTSWTLYVGTRLAAFLILAFGVARIGAGRLPRWGTAVRVIGLAGVLNVGFDFTHRALLWNLGVYRLEESGPFLTLAVIEAVGPPLISMLIAAAVAWGLHRLGRVREWSSTSQAAGSVGADRH